MKLLLLLLLLLLLVLLLSVLSEEHTDTRMGGPWGLVWACF
jgi:hypothetical protein